MPTRIRVALFLCTLLLPSFAFAQQPAPAAQPPATTPLTIHLGDADFLIGGFIEAMGLFRSTNVASGPATTFSTIPFGNTLPGHLHETRLTAQSSRANLLITVPVGQASVKSFLEIDFSGSGPGNLYVYANSHTPRMRLAWAQYSRGKFEFTGGQTWSLLVPNRNGLSPVTGDVVTSQNLDLNLQLGLAWARQAQFRFVAHPTKTFAAGVSIENAQPFVGSAVVLPASFPDSQVDDGTTAGAPSPYPDIIGKVAFDPQTGKTHQHLEAAVLVRGYHTYNPATNHGYSATGTGFALSGVFQPVKSVSIIGTTVMSDGGGRYMTGQAPDFMVNPDASITTIGSNSGMVGVEAQVKPATMLFGYWGTVRVDRVTALDGMQQIGYGIDGATAANHTIDETTIGFNHAFFREPRYGAMQLIAQYSYVTRTPWSVPANTPANAKSHMVFVSVRYVLP